ncbi:AarF/ABC1/UbiB kinase family protein [Moraxella bovis]|uniref:ABC1 kinase family protein n=1 Tax=Moraxella bovis TaxID=476 RepID=UPI002226F4C3|nr:AarF/ABC1/UbiB kinase family protein [Moraxella bovis]UYZ67448.1 AarF/ABC1/UbiB kinase family protein [Moraxella bovis]UYZ69808.1 AarF/ABC1/UbiB kinase family protein [Moraxella bovis]UYZ74271.1 AarF/ABC1/UbiB kinase family protein [Moraxella bovis]UYZ93920.1 AarF/ABC1/UbiB kinase family protein [Moraxella bovis]UZA13092.1 AarF/ABC1/UbiB kinase family protein [Moraxella bovis]
MTDKKPLDTVKTSTLSRQLSIAKTSLNIGKNWAKSGVTGLFLSKEQRELQKHTLMQEQADYLVAELGKLKGSVVKVGQMLALYGEHMLPREVVNALHTLDAQTAPLAWHIIYQTVQAELGERIDDFEIEQTPIGTASLAQVHKATHKYSGREVVLKVQYPNVAQAIDSDLSLFKHLLKVTNAVPQTKALDDWFGEIRQLLHREVDYVMEANTTKRFADYLKGDERYIVPTIYDNYSTPRLICMSYEAGIHLNDPALQSLNQTRRNHLGQSAIDIVIREIFEWGEMQTDPNFGNYLVRLDDVTEQDKLILLDFGAIKQFDDKLLTIAKNLLIAGHYQDKTMMKNAMTGYDFFDKLTGKPQDNVADVLMMACEPFADSDTADSEYLDDDKYIWAKSDLYQRVMTTAKSGMQSLEFSLPPKELMFISRKFIGAYALLSALDSRTDADRLVKRHIAKNAQ